MDVSGIKPINQSVCQSKQMPVNSSHSHIVTQSTRHCQLVTTS